jgi:hypothetical protein
MNKSSLNDRLIINESQRDHIAVRVKMALSQIFVAGFLFVAALMQGTLLE